MEARFRVDRLLWEMAQSIDNKVITQTIPQPKNWLRDATTSADSRIHDPSFSVGELARLAGCSENHLNRSIRKYYRRTSQAFIRQLRINRAQHMLTQDPTLDCVEIAMRCGFSYARHLHDQWRKETGISFRAYRSEQ